MDNITKFNGVDYQNTFARRISVMHGLVKDVLSVQIKNGNHIIDIGGGPGMGARIIDEFGIKATVANIEPSTTIDDVPHLPHVEYLPLKMSFVEALDARMPFSGDCLLIVSSAHEIALCHNDSAAGNKKIFFSCLNRFIQKNLRQNGKVIIGFPNYKTGASPSEIARQRKLTESLLGHSHPPEELFSVEEFSHEFGSNPIVFIQKPMNLEPGSRADTILMANVAVFNVAGQ